MIMTPLYPLGSSPTEEAPQKWGALLCTKGDKCCFCKVNN